jgi:hypothetical protein
MEKGGQKGLQTESPKGRDHFGDLDEDERIILKVIL